MRIISRDEGEYYNWSEFVIFASTGSIINFSTFIILIIHCKML